ncbi:hypothetical protein PCE1_000238 [Barthelona sp. PCE]
MNFFLNFKKREEESFREFKKPNSFKHLIIPVVIIIASLTYHFIKTYNQFSNLSVAILWIAIGFVVLFGALPSILSSKLKGWATFSIVSTSMLLVLVINFVFASEQHLFLLAPSLVAFSLFSIPIISFRFAIMWYAFSAIFQGVYLQFYQSDLVFVWLFTNFSCVALALLYREQERKVRNTFCDMLTTNRMLSYSETLFRRTMPEEVVEPLLEHGTRQYLDRTAALCFIEVCGFDHYSKQVSPVQSLQALNSVFSSFDEIATIYDIETIKTVSHIYMAGKGLFRNERTPCVNLLSFCLACQEAIKVKNDYSFVIRCGIHYGTVSAGVLGKTKMLFDVLGDTVNTASRMMSSSPKDHVQISAAVKAQVELFEHFSIFSRGTIAVKGKGAMQTFFVQKNTNMLLTADSPSIMANPRLKRIISGLPSVTRPRSRATSGISPKSLKRTRSTLLHRRSRASRKDEAMMAKNAKFTFKDYQTFFKDRIGSLKSLLIALCLLFLILFLYLVLGTDTSPVIWGGFGVLSIGYPLFAFLLLRYYRATEKTWKRVVFALNFVLVIDTIGYVVLSKYIPYDDLPWIDDLISVCILSFVIFLSINHIDSLFFSFLIAALIGYRSITHTQIQDLFLFLCIPLPVRGISKKQLILLKKTNEQGEKATNLLNNILPQPLAQSLRQYSDPRKDDTRLRLAQQSNNCSVLQADIVGFTTFCSTRQAGDVLGLLNVVFDRLDARIAMYPACEKVKTVGDAYIVVSGVPTANFNHARDLADIALGFIHDIKQVSTRFGLDIKLRIGIASGPVLAGVVGSKFSYDIFGPTVYNVGLLESGGQPGLIHVDVKTYQLLNNQFEFEKASKDTYFITAKKGITTIPLEPPAFKGLDTNMNFNVDLPVKDYVSGEEVLDKLAARSNAVKSLHVKVNPLLYATKDLKIK